jgi:hypothetical protein
MVWKLDKMYCKFYGNLCTFTVSKHFVFLYNEVIAQWKPQASTVQIANFGTRAVVRNKANKGPKGVEQGCLQMKLHSAIKVLSGIILEALPTPSVCP